MVAFQKALEWLNTITIASSPLLPKLFIIFSIFGSIFPILKTLVQIETWL